MDLRQQLREYLNIYKTTGWLIALMIGGILVQGLLFVGLAFATGKMNNELYPQVMSFLILPQDFGTFISRPWTLFTYPFFYPRFNLFTLLFNGLIIWNFGRIHQQLLDDQRTQRLSMLTVPVIGILAVLFGSFLPMPQGEIASYASVSVFGAASVMMVLIMSSVTLVPDFSIQLFLFGRVKILWVGIAILVIEIFAYSSTYVSLVMPIVIGLSAAFGFLHVYMLRQGFDLTERVWAFYQDSSPKPKMTVKHGSAKPEPKKNRKVNQKGDIPQDLIDNILDKISEKGYESLTREEKELLFKASTQKEENEDKP